VPCGPFSSSESETGHGFSCLHMAVVHNRAEPWDQKFWRPVRSGTGLSWGLVSVEACFAGGFFRHLPEALLFEPLSTSGSATKCVQMLASSVPRQPPKVAVPFEAIVYIHGFASSLQEATLPFGQLLALADLPAHLKPFVFSWPCGHYLSYFAATRCGESAEVAADLCAFFQGLQDAGCSAVHVIAYSLGAHLLLSSLPWIEGKFRRAPGAPMGGGCLGGGGGANASLRLATVMLMSPDHPLEQFVNVDYYSLRAICDCITLYADEQDVALAIGEAFKREKGLSRYPFALVHAAEGAGEEEPSEESKGGLERGSQGSSSLHVRPLDLDVINTSFLDDNVPQLRHINLPANVHVVDDLRDIVTMRLRASERRRTSRMIRLGRAANVYSFLAAPNHVSQDGLT